MEHNTHHHDDSNKKRGFIFTPILVAAGVISVAVLGINYFAGNFGGKSDGHDSHSHHSHGKDSVKVDSVKVESTDVKSGDITLTVAEGTTVTAHAGGIEEQLTNFFKTDWKSLTEDSLKKTWFNFDDLNFESGSSKITESSKRQVSNIVAILKSFPDAKVKIGGYTDKVGVEASNMKLSTERAKAVMTALMAEGIEAKQITGAEGYGSKFAIFPADASEEERATDRKIALSPRK